MKIISTKEISHSKNQTTNTMKQILFILAITFISGHMKAQNIRYDVKFTPPDTVQVFAITLTGDTLGWFYDKYCPCTGRPYTFDNIHFWSWDQPVYYKKPEEKTMNQ